MLQRQLQPGVVVLSCVVPLTFCVAHLHLLINKHGRECAETQPSINIARIRAQTTAVTRRREFGVFMHDTTRVSVVFSAVHVRVGRAAISAALPSIDTASA